MYLTVYYNVFNKIHLQFRIYNIKIYDQYIDSVHFSFREFSENHKKNIKKSIFLEIRYPIISESVYLHYWLNNEDWQRQK